MKSKLSQSLLEKGKAKKEWVLFLINNIILTWNPQVSNSNEKTILQGISSLHSWIKTQTMIKPSKISRQHSREEEEDEDEPEVVIHLTSLNPQASRKYYLLCNGIFLSKPVQKVCQIWRDRARILLSEFGTEESLLYRSSRDHKHHRQERLGGSK